jgi:hypothetical protein
MNNKNICFTEFSKSETSDVVESVDSFEENVVMTLRAELQNGAAEKIKLEKIKIEKECYK